MNLAATLRHANHAGSSPRPALPAACRVNITEMMHGGRGATRDGFVVVAPRCCCRALAALGAPAPLLLDCEGFHDGRARPRTRHGRGVTVRALAGGRQWAVEAGQSSARAVRVGAERGREHRPV